MVAEALEVPVEVQDADALVLGGSGDRQVGEGEAMGTVRAAGCQLTHRCENSPLHATIH